MQIRLIGIDLGKTTFHLIALDEHVKVVTRKKILSKTAIGVHGQSACLVDRDEG